MTDTEMLGRVLGALDPQAGPLHGLHRGGRILLGLPADPETAQRTLRLYQPQRWQARAMVSLLRAGVTLGQHTRMLPLLQFARPAALLTPAVSGIETGRCGVMLGSPEHQVRRAIVCMKTANGWEVAKVACGAAGWDVIRGEADVLQSLPERTPGVPPLLGVHRGAELALLRLPLISGTPLRQGDHNDALSLLESWLSDQPPRPITEFPEWPAIEVALSTTPAGRMAMERLATHSLRPAIRHGDFARWNLLRTADGELKVLDWEWAMACGLPGLDLVHFFSQDARLVRRLSAPQVLRAVEQALAHPACLDYLERGGWQGDIYSVTLASLAFTVGSRQQANEAILAALLQAQ